MKKLKLIFICLLLIVVSNSYCQTYHQFPDSNAVWCADRGLLNYQPLDTDEYHTYTYQQYLLGDTLINGVAYHKIIENGIFSWVAIPPYYMGSLPYYNQYDGCYRESNKQIFYVPPSTTTEYLLYDFNLNIGDTLPPTYVNGAGSIVVTSIDSIYDGNSYRKRFNLSTADTTLWQWAGNYLYASIIEGIGSTHGLLWYLEPYFEIGGALFSFKQNGIVIYPDTISSCEITGIQNILPRNNSIELFPNPAATTLTLIVHDMKTVSASIEIYNSIGDIIYSKNIFIGQETIDISDLPSGIYLLKFQNIIRKFVKQ